MHSGDTPLTVPALTFGVTTIVIPLEVAVVGLAQAKDDVITTVIISLFTNAAF